jgi:steroid delta-isomerase-like uncharacterized protein
MQDTSREALAALTARWISLWSAPVDWALFDELHADDFVDCSAAGRVATKAGFAEGIRALLAAFPDLHTRVNGLVIDEPAQLVAVRWSAAGTNRLRYLGVGPTHASTTITGIEIIEVVAGRIARRWGEWDITRHLAHSGGSESPVRPGGVWPETPR